MAGHRNKDVDFVPRVGDRTGGYFFYPPGSPSPCVPVPASSCWLHVSLVHLGHSTIWQGATAPHARYNWQSEVAIHITY